MAAIYAFRIAYWLGSGAVAVRSTQTSSGQPGYEEVLRYFKHRLINDGEHLGILSSDMTTYSGYDWQVETFAEPFEVRKLQVRWGRNSGAAGGTDDAVTTHHFIYVPSGTPSSTWTATQFGAVETAFGVWWAAVKINWQGTTILKQYRWYKDGPAIAPPQPPVRVVDLSVAGGAGASSAMPPQVAISVTEKTSDPKSWGRFYLPAPAINVMGTSNGRLTSAFQSALADALDTFYESCYTASTAPVVYSAAKPVRETKAGTELAAIAARALPVKQLQIDDVCDVIRSRRWNEPLLRTQRDLAGS